MMDAGAQPPEASGSDVELEELLKSFARIQAVDDPVRRRIVLLREAERLHLDVNSFSGLFDLYSRRTMAPKWLLERYTEKIVAWASSLSFFSLLEYIGRLAIVLAIASFFIDLPAEHKQRQEEAWQTAESASGQVYSQARIDALEGLNYDCVSLKGLSAPGADLRGLHLDRCFRTPGGNLLGRWFPGFFRRAGTVLAGANLAGADLQRSQLPAADLSQARLDGAHLVQAGLEGAVLRSAHLNNADLFLANLQGAKLSGADLRGADLTNADLSGADLSKALLTGAKLTGANLRGAILEGSVLDTANLARTDLRHADFFFADLRNAVLRKSRFDERTGFDKAAIAGVDLHGTLLPSPDHLEVARGYDPRLLAGVTLTGLPAARRRLKIGLILPDPGQSFYLQVSDGARAAAKGKAELVVRTIEDPDHRLSPAGKLEKEAAILRELTALGVDGVIMVPQDENQSARAIRDALAAGLVAVCYDHCLNPADSARLIVAQYSSDQFELGRQTGRALVRSLAQEGRWTGPLELGIFNFCEFEGCYQRVRGFRAALDAARRPWIEAAYRGQEGTEPSRDGALDLVGKHPNLALLWASNEEGTNALVDAVHALHLQGKTRVWGTDISPQIAQRLGDKDGVLQGVTGQSPEQMGNSAMTAVLRALAARRGAPFESVALDLRPFSRDDPGAVAQYLAGHPAW